MLGRLKQAFSNAITWDNRDDVRANALADYDGGQFIPLSSLGGESNPRGLAAVPAVYGAVNLISDQISLLKPVVRIGKYDYRPKHPISTLLNNPSKMFNKVQYWRMQVRLYALHGNSYAYIQRDWRTKRAVQLIPAYCTNSYWVERRNSPTQHYKLHLIGRDAFGRLTYSQQVSADARDVLTYHGPGFNGLYSPSPVRYAAAAILGVMSKVLTHEGQLIEKDMNGNTFIHTTDANNLSFEQWQKGKEQIEEEINSVREDGRIPLLPPGLEAKRLQLLTAQDLQLIELLKWGVEDVCRVWQVPPLRLAHYYQGMRVAGVENQAVDFERFSIQNRTGLLDSENTMKLLSVDERLDEMDIWTDTSPIGLGTLAERMDVAEQGVTRGGFWTIDEGRELTDLPPRPNNEGNRLLEPKGAPSQNPPPNDSRAKRVRQIEMGEGE